MPETPQGREPLGGAYGMLVTLAGDVRVLSEKLKTVETGLAEHEHTSDAQSDLAEKVEKLRGEVEKLLAVQKPTVWDWSTMELDEAANAWEILSGWVQAVLTDQLMVVHWNVSADDKTNVKLNEKKIEKPQAFSPCWRQHRDVIWLLTPLCQSWLEIHGSGGKATADLEWQARQLPAVIARLALSSAQWCVLGCHLAPHGAGWHVKDILTHVTEEERAIDRARLEAEAKRFLGQAAKR